MIEQGGARMLSIINDLIDISKIESGQKHVSISACNVNEQIEYMYTFFKPEVEKKGMQIFFQNSLSAKDAVIETDSEKILAILSNLINNAIKYSDKGTIEFGYNVKKVDKPAIMTDIDHVDLMNKKLLDKVPGEPVELEFFVKDTGLGIPKDKLKVIFDRFIQAYNDETRVFQGAGLGLAISKAYVEMLGGKIWVESQTGIGSSFFFYNSLQ